MSIRAPSRSARRAAGSRRDGATDAVPQTVDETAPLHVGSESDGSILDSFGLLDQRTRARSIPLRLAPYGRYLAFGDGEQTRLVRLDQRITHLGRGLAAELRFEDQRVSRSHAILVRHGRVIRLLDNRSANGTFLNGRRVIATNIQHGDVIRLGPVVAQYLEVG